MTDTTRDLLRRALAKGYDKLRRKLARRLGSDSLAGDVLHETWINIGQGSELGPVSDHEAYIYRAAVNTATNMRVANERRPHAMDIKEALDVIDEMPEPERIAEGLDEMRVVLETVAKLSDRKRDAFHLCFLQGMSSADVAKLHNVSQRTVQEDLRAAIVQCARKLGRKDILADRSFKLSRE